MFVASAGFVVGAVFAGLGSSVDFEFCGEESVMSDSPNAEDLEKNALLAHERLWKMYDAAVMVNRRFKDHSAYILSASAAGFGLIGSTLDNHSHSTWQILLLFVAVAFLVVEFVFAYQIWKPRFGKFPGTCDDLNHVWSGYVDIPRASTIANHMDDLCLSINVELKRNGIVAVHFERFLIAATGSLALIAIASIC